MFINNRFKNSYNTIRNGFTILELLVVFLVISILLGLLLPAINAARETARQVRCKNNLYQIGIALQNYHNVYTKFPSGLRTDLEEESAFGWAASILPFLGQINTSHQIEFQESVDSPPNLQASSSTPEVFQCPSDLSTQRFELFEELEGHESGGTESKVVLIELPNSNYIGVFGFTDPDNTLGQNGEGAFVINRWCSFNDFRRGSSNTIVVGERTARKLPSTWFGVMMEGEDAAGRILGNAYLGPNRPDSDECEFDSRHPGLVNFLWGDCHVKSIHNQIDKTVYRKTSTLHLQ